MKPWMGWFAPPKKKKKDSESFNLNFLLIISMLSLIVFLLILASLIGELFYNCPV